VAGALAAAAPAAAPKPGVWGRYLLAYSSCDSAGSCRQELVQSRDGIRWATVTGFAKRPGKRPVAIRRASRLYVFDGLSVRRLTIGARSLSELPPTTVSLDSTVPPGWTDVVAEPSGGLVLVYAETLDTGEVAVRTATEEPGSDGTAFITDPGDRLVLDASAGPVSLLRGRSGWVGLNADAECLHALAGGNVRGAYRETGCLTMPSPVSSPSGWWNPRLKRYVLYGLADGAIRRATTPRVNVPLRASRFRPLRRLVPAGRTIGSARFWGS
jgi:hypothetical protein